MSEHRGQSELEQGLSELLEHDFSQPALLRLALTHSSLGYEEQMAREAESSATTAKDNEQLEFIGDAVLGLIVAETLYRRYPHLREGDLTRLRASLVSRKHLAERAAELRLGDYLRLGKGEETTGGRKKPALLSDAMEAVVAALYLDGGMGAATKFVMARIVEPALPALAEAMGGGGAIGDWKSALQEHVQALGMGQARYTVTAESGPDHEKRFSVEVRLEKNGGSRVLGAATAETKKAAQQKAAEAAFTELRAAQEPQPQEEERS